MTGKLAAATGLHRLLFVRGQLPFFCWGVSCRWLVCFTVQCCSLWFSFSFAVLLSRRAYIISSICSGVILHSVSTVIMSWCGGPLCRLPVNVDTCMVVFTHMCAFAQSVYTWVWLLQATLRVCVRTVECVNMSGCRRRPISWCISGKVSIHTPVCGPVTPAHHTITYGQTALLCS